MMSQVSATELLDCTLRDGGYYTAWDFERRTVDAYLDAMARLPVSTVELGYANPPRPGYAGQYFHLTSKETARARSRLSPHQALGVMLDEKAVAPDALPALIRPLAEHVSVVRLAVSPGRLAEAAVLGDRLKQEGMRVGINVMYLSKYWDRVADVFGDSGLGDVAETVALVDSYGACTPEDVSVAVNAARAVLPRTKIGFHGHDNLGLALANSLAATTAGAAVIDGTIRGMGRGPGNTRMELLLAQLFATTKIDYDALNLALQAFETLEREYGWGTNLAYMISGAAGLPQNDVMDWLGKNRYSVDAIVHALHGDAPDNVDHSTFPPVSTQGNPRRAVIIGGGQSVASHREAVLELIKRENPVVIHANYRHLDLVRELRGAQFVCVAGDAMSRVPREIVEDDRVTLVVPSAPRFNGATPNRDARVAQVDSFAREHENPALGPVSDIAPLAVGLGIVCALGSEHVTLLGFDGYPVADVAKQELARETQAMVDQFRNTRPDVRLTSGTRTLYDLSVDSIYGRLMQ